MGEKVLQSRKVETIADDLVNKLGAKTDSRPFLCKVAWKLPEPIIYKHVETATGPKSKNPMGLFIYLCKRDGV